MRASRLALIAAVLLPVAASAGDSAPPSPAAPPVSNTIPIALLVDLSAGQTLYARNAEQHFLPASMTKAMSALVAFDLIAGGKLKEDAVFTVRPATAARWAGKGTTLTLRPGETIAVRDLLMGTTTVSANDAAVALAEGAAGSTEAWCALMNARARTLGMTDSHFASPNGFPDHGQTYVSARDLMRLARALIADHPALYHRYFGHQAMVWRGQRLTSHDPFAGVLPGADGIKTGHSFEAGFNFLGAVERGGRRLVLVVGKAPTEPGRAAAARALAEWGYGEWDGRAFVPAGWIAGAARVQGGDAREVPLALPRAFSLAVPRGTHPAVSARIVYRGPLMAPLAKGTVVAGLEVSVEGQGVHYLPLVTAKAVDKAGMFDRIANGLLGLGS